MVVGDVPDIMTNFAFWPETALSCGVAVKLVQRQKLVTLFTELGLYCVH